MTHLVGVLALAGLTLGNDPPDPGTHVCPTRSFRVPVEFRPTTPGTLQGAQVFVSTDQGATWRQITLVTTEEMSFRFDAPADGEFWFAVREVRKDGTHYPAQLGDLRPAMKTLVRTQPVPAGF